MSTSNRRIEQIEPIQPPQKLLQRLALDAASEQLVNTTRARISDILYGRDQRLLVIAGPCSIHDVPAALEYATRLSELRSRHADDLEIVMRVYFEKPRTTIGWKGLINDPDLNGSFQVDKGLSIARDLLLQINKLGLPAGCEFLDAVTGQYYADLVSWGAIGARTTESQVHRELASGLSCPVGFKNGTNGNVKIAADAVVAARSQHSFLSPTEAGQTALFTTSGNPDAHVILRGGQQPNYAAADVAAAKQLLESRDIATGLMIDFSHANSQKQYTRQVDVANDVARQIAGGSRAIAGCMIESHLVEGAQSLVPGKNLTYGQSITDACIGFDSTVSVLETLAEAVRSRRQSIN